MIARLMGRKATSPVPLPADVEFRVGRWIPMLGGRLAGTRGPAAAVTIGRTIVVHPDAQVTARLIRHELAHVAQWRARPWTFILRYALGHLRHGYRDNPYEVEARRAERE